MIRNHIKHTIRKLTPSQISAFLVRLGRFYNRGDARDDTPSFPSQEAAFQTLKSLGWAPKNCIDVGAYHGDWATMFLSIYPETQVLMVEGQEGKEGRLKEVVATSPKKLEYEIALLGSTDGTEVEFIEMETGSSVFEESSPYDRKKKKAKLTKLDTLLTRHADFQHAEALKLDTQGYEIEVMKGAESLLETVEVVLLEVSLVPVNKGAPLFSEVVEFMTSRNFKLFDFCSQIRRKDGVLWQTDLMFIREGCVPNLQANLTEENWG